VTSGPCAITTEDRDGVAVVRLEGELDLTNADDVRDAVAATTAGGVVLDVTAVSYLDSSGLRAIERGHRQLASEDRSLFIVSPPGTPSSWTFRVAGFGGEVVLETLDAALASALRARIAQ
jgi:stage II sporulation protein AA (anti-sigma F factor antagonist)